MRDIVTEPVLSRSTITLASVTFLTEQGTPYLPSTVEKKVVNSDGVVITDWENVGDSSGFANGDDILVTADETDMVDDTLAYERHIVLVVGNRGTEVEHPLRVIVPINNRDLA